jgi:5-methylcytosine-specific restriction endonuclease McrA
MILNQQVSIDVIYQRAAKNFLGESKVTLTASEPVRLIAESGEGFREQTFRQSINALSGIQKRVMTDLYRNMVRGNFTRYNGKGGKAAALQMEKEYPDQGTLMGWEHLSDNFNGTGAIIYYLVRHGDSDKVEHQVLVGILLALLNKGIGDTPRLEPTKEILERFPVIRAASNVSVDSAPSINPTRKFSLDTNFNIASPSPANLPSSTPDSARSRSGESGFSEQTNDAREVVTQSQPSTADPVIHFDLAQVVQDLEGSHVNDLADIARPEEKYKFAEPRIIEVVSSKIERGTISEKFKRLSGFKCLVCEALGQHPYAFKKKGGRDYYVEVHHVIPVSRREMGTLGTANLITVCPNHHRQIHYGDTELLEITNDDFNFQIDGKRLTLPKFKLPSN